jgi:SAM-dependent methyltransferase
MSGVTKDCNRRCPVCGGGTGEVVTRQEFVAPTALFAASAVDIVLCDSCGMCFTDVALAQATVDTSYAEHSKYADTSVYEEAIEVVDVPTGAPWDLERLEATAEWLAAVVPHSARVLDAGCATGALIGYLQREGFADVVGLDPSPVAIAHARQAYGVPAVTGSFMDPPRDLGQFDLVVLSHVLEHLVDVQGAVASLRSLVKPGGAVYIEVPDAMRYHEFLVAPFHDFNTEHVNHFSDRLLSRLMRTSGFEVRELHTKIVQVAPESSYPAVFGLFERAAADGEAHRAAEPPDVALGEAIRAYVRGSEQMLEGLDAWLRAEVGRGPVVVWGAGQLAMKLLAGPLRDTRVEAIIDSAHDKWGGCFGDVPVIDPARLDELDDGDVPILVASIHHQDSIVSAITTSFPQRRYVTLR